MNLNRAAGNPDPSHRSLLGEDLWDLVRSTVAAPLVECASITALPTAELSRATFRLAFSNGVTLKGKYLAEVKTAKRIESLLRLLDCPRFPKLLGRYKRALLTEWIEGEVLKIGACKLEMFSDWGRFQGALHSMPVPQEFSAFIVEGSESWHDRVKFNLQHLSRLGIIEAGEEKTALAQAFGQTPREIDKRIIHGDLCTENIIVSSSGRSYLVDNETLRIDAPEFDLARTWYRWPMSAFQWKAYLDGYSEERSLSAFEKYFCFWNIAAVSGAAVFRLRAKTRDWEVPVSTLKSLISRRSSSGDWSAARPPTAPSQAADSSEQ